MNKAQLVQAISDQTGIPKNQAEDVLDCVLKNITKSLKKGEDVKLVGFGTFTKTKRKARSGRNPKNGETIKIPASFAPKFKPGTELKALLN